jgi:hypothetical protein
VSGSGKGEIIRHHHRQWTEVEDKVEHSGERGKGQESWEQGERESVQQIPSPFIHSCIGKLMRTGLGVRTPRAIYSNTDRGAQSLPLS